MVCFLIFIVVCRRPLSDNRKGTELVLDTRRTSLFGLRPGLTQEGGSVRKRKRDCKLDLGKHTHRINLKKEIMKER